MTRSGRVSLVVWLTLGDITVPWSRSFSEPWAPESRLAPRPRVARSRAERASSPVPPNLCCRGADVGPGAGRVTTPVKVVRLKSGTSRQRRVLLRVSSFSVWSSLCFGAVRLWPIGRLAARHGPPGPHRATAVSRVSEHPVRTGVVGVGSDCAVVDYREEQAAAGTAAATTVCVAERTGGGGGGGAPFGGLGGGGGWGSARRFVFWGPRPP